MNEQYQECVLCGEHLDDAGLILADDYIDKQPVEILGVIEHVIDIRDKRSVT